jgi:hypothetical protein
MDRHQWIGSDLASCDLPAPLAVSRSRGLASTSSRAGKSSTRITRGRGGVAKGGTASSSVELPWLAHLRPHAREGQTGRPTAWPASLRSQAREGGRAACGLDGSPCPALPAPARDGRRAGADELEARHGHPHTIENSVANRMQTRGWEGGRLVLSAVTDGAGSAGRAAGVRKNEK